MKKFALAALVAAFSLVGFSAPVFADSPGQLSNGDNNYKVRNVTKNTGYGKSVALECNETAKYSITLSNSDFGLLRDLTVRASLPNNISASAVNANNETTSVAGTVSVTAPAGATLDYVSGSTQLFNSNGQLIRNLSNGITTGGVNAGNLNGSTAVFVQFQVKATCATTPVTPQGPVTPTPVMTTPVELPKTGPEATAAIAAAYLSVLTGGAAYMLQARRGNLG